MVLIDLRSTDPQLLQEFVPLGLRGSRRYSFLTLQSSELVNLRTREEIDGLNYPSRSMTQNYFGSSGFPFLEGSSFQGIGRALADSSTWVFIAGAWTLDLVHSGRVSCAIWFIGCIGRIGEKEGNFEIQIYFVCGSYTSDLTLRLHLVTCSVPIYLSSKFQGIWRPPSSGTKL
jgi:hypothetical protein